MNKPPSPDRTDRELVRRAQKGDRQAVGALYMRYRRRVCNYLYRYTGDRATAEDLTQEAFIRVVRYIASYRPTGSVSGWIYRIAGNLALNQVRARKAGREISLDEPVFVGEEETVDRSGMIGGATPSPSELFARTEIEKSIQRALLKIPVAFREAVILCDIEGCPYREAAEVLNCSMNTVASRLARGRSQLAKLLAPLKKEMVR